MDLQYIEMFMVLVRLLSTAVLWVLLNNVRSLDYIKVIIKAERIVDQSISCLTENCYFDY